MLGRMLETIKQRSFRGIQEKTKKLDPVTRKNLQEFLEDIPEEQEELKLIEEELDKVRVNLTKLREKEAFVGMRLVSYRKQVQDLSAQQPNSAAAAALETTQKFTVALEQIAKSHESMINDIRMLEERIHSMEQRKYELKYKTEECQVVLETTEALQRQEKDLEEEEEEAAAAAAASAAASAAEQNDSPGIIQVEMATTSSSSKQAVSDCDDLHLEEGLVVSQEEA